jgi:integrase
MAFLLHKSSVRNALEPRREPYWGAPIARGQYVGLRKIDGATATWIARYRDDDGHQHYKSLGFATSDFDFDKAANDAKAFFKLKADGIKTDEVTTVAEACKAYVAGLRADKRESTAHDAEKRFERTVYDTTFGHHSLAKLRATHVSNWRNSLDLGKASANRTLTALKAALNLAVRERNVAGSQAQEWKDVKPYKDAGKRRDLYLDLKQRRALLAKAEGALHDLIEAATLTGARAGELVNATRSQFDARTKSMTFTGKTGSRTVPLAPAAVKLFERLAKSKTPAARLLVRSDGMPWAHSDWDELVREAATAAELPEGTCLYTLRHSFITTALTGGLATLDVARLVGTSVMMIEKHYGHLVASAARERLAKVAML